MGALERWQDAAGRESSGGLMRPALALKAAPTSSEQQEQNDDQEDKAEAAATIIA
jgi:hypothetical protein